MTKTDETQIAASSKVSQLRKTLPCPICKKQSHRDAYPFCSKRCKDVDLGRWLNGSYAIAAVEDEVDGER